MNKLEVAKRIMENANIVEVSTLAVLKKMAKDLELKGVSRMNKLELGETIKAAALDIVKENEPSDLTDKVDDVVPTKAVLKTFTGMVIGKVQADGRPYEYDIKDNGSEYALQKLNGEILTFDKTTLKQTNAKNPKFANKIDIVF